MEILNNYNVNYHMSIMKKYIALSDELIFATPFLSEDIDYLFKELGVEPHLNKITLITVLKSFDESLRKAYILYKFIKFCEENKIIYEVIIDEKLHGKVYMFYKDKKEIGTIISSANLTQKGLINNHEWGVLFQESEKQKKFMMF